MPALKFVRVALPLMIVALATLMAVPRAQAAVTCPNANPIVQENQCMGVGSSTWQLTNPSDDVGGFTTKTSYNRGEAVALKIGRNQPAFPASTVTVTVYRTGYYGGLGARQVVNPTNVSVNNSFAGCTSPNYSTGLRSCSSWNTSLTIPGASLPATGVYVAKIRTLDTGEETWVVWIVRDDSRATPSKLIDIIPTASWQAYNTWGGKSLYFDKDGTGQVAATGTQRAAKVSFDRPLDNVDAEQNRYFGVDFHLTQWLEQQGYDVSYTDDVAANAAPAELKEHKAVVISGHSEYWSLGEYDAVQGARDAGINVASFSANTAYWKVRYEDGDRTLVCYKTVQGDGTGSSGSISDNDWGPDKVKGTADDALGADGIAGTPDDHRENSTTTWRDNGAPNGDLNAPPGGRVGPDRPENSLFGVLYVGDNDSLNYNLVIPAGNANGEYAGNRLWRNAGIPTNSATTVPGGFVGWEWDAVPTLGQYASKQPANVKRLSETPALAGTPSWLQDEGRQRSTTPPAGQPGTVSAVSYRATSGALVFASGTMQWAWALANTPDARLQQATYNVFSDMGVQPDTPVGVTLDAGGSNVPPIASFTTPANPVKPNIAIAFNASGSTDAGGSIVKYEWDWDGDSVYDTTTTTPNTTHTFTAEGSYDVRLRVTDNGGATDITVRTVVVLGNQPPVAAFTANPNPSVVGQIVHFSGAGSSDPDGTITAYKWDFDGNGSFETSGGTNAAIDHTFTATGTYQVGLQVTDNGGKTATATVPVTVNSGGVSSYADSVLRTAGLKDYWRMGETAGPTLADSKGTTPATATGGVFQQPGGPAFDPNTAVEFNGSSDYAKAPLDLSSNQAITVEFWLKWNTFADDDSLAMEFTPNFNANAGGFLVDPNAPQGGGKFGIALGSSANNTRNNAFFTRPSAGVWHHYAIVMDTTAPGATQITPYVDGQAVAYTKQDSYTGSGSFANSTLYMMSRGGVGLWGRGGLDEVAIYDRALTAAQIADHFGSYGTNRRPTAAFTATPNPVKTGVAVTFNGSSSSDPDGSITKYEWDLDGNGSYETVTGSTPTATKTYATAGNVDVHLRVTDSAFGNDTTTKTILVGNQGPTAALVATPNPAIQGQTVAFNASTSTDSDGTIVKYEWDLDGDGTYESTTTTPTASKAYASVGTVPVHLRVTDNDALTNTVTLPLTVNSGGVSSYGDAVTRTPGLVHYWRLGESTGTLLADGVGTSTATLTSGTLGVPGAVAQDPNTATRFNGNSSSAKASVNLSGTSKLTVEFWLKWDAYAGDDDLAMEFTPNFNGTSGGFIVDPNAPQFGGTVGFGIGRQESRNNVFIPRPSAGAWHHYAFVVNAAAPPATQITPYVDGQPVTYQKLDSGSGMGNFANSTLALMSRDGAALFGAGDLDEVALYADTLSAAQISDHYGSRGTNRRPTASFTLTPAAAKAGQTVTFNGSASSDPDGTITKYEWDLDGDGIYETDSGTNPVVTKSYATEATYQPRLRVTDNQFGTDSQTHTLVIASTAPVASFTMTPSPAQVGQTVQFDASASTDQDGTITKYEWDLDGNGTFETNGATSPTTSRNYPTAGTFAIGLRVTDSDTKTTTLTKSLTVKAGTYADTITATPGILNYWRMGEASGTTLQDTVGAQTATLTGGLLGAAGALVGDSNTATTFNGTTSWARAPLNLSTRNTITIEFWLKWTRWADDDDLAMEFTSNFNANAGGFLIDPDSSDGSFAVALGVDGSRNNVHFARPTAGVWHHYAFVLNTTAAGATQIIPYVDGQPVSYTKSASGTGGGTFANDYLYMMTRGGGNLFGAGSLDEVAVYGSALSAATISAHYAAGS